MTWLMTSSLAVVLLLVVHGALALEDQESLQLEDVNGSPKVMNTTENKTMDDGGNSTRFNKCEEEKYCIMRTMDVIYENRNNNLFCGHNYHFFSTESDIKRNAFLEGKNCFLETAQQTCLSISADLLQRSYDEMFANYTTEPSQSDRENCTGPYFELENIQWLVARSYYYKMMAKTLLKNATHEEHSDAIDATRDARLYASSCAIPEQQRSQMSNILNYLEIATLPVHRCMVSISKEKIDVPHNNRNEITIGTLIKEDSCKIFLPPTRYFKNLILRNCPYQAYKSFLAISKMLGDKC